MQKKILVVDDEKPIADILEFNLKKKVMKYIVLMMGKQPCKWWRISNQI